MQNVTVKLSSHSYKIGIGHNLLQTCGTWAKNCLNEQTTKLIVVSNKKVFDLYGEKTQKSLENAGFEVTVHLIGDGEKYKNFRTLEKILKFFSENKLKRTDAVIALGGGVVGDLTGFAASIYLRGIPFLQIPTTLLAMIDSSVGGKTAVNSDFGKNLIGTFYQPNGVLVDAETLKTLPRRELVAGFCEAIKQGAIGGQDLFDETARFLQFNPIKGFMPTFNATNGLENLLANQVKFKAEIVTNDEKEDILRTDSRSRKILNFGHTIGHALEKLTGYKRFKHGEAVGIGMLVAADISNKLDLLSQHQLDLLNNVLHCFGKFPKTSDIEIESVVEAILFDKKAVGKSVQWILLEEIGKPKIISGVEIPEDLLKKSLKKILKT
jgi:3-dehydroquinate synthase